MKLFTSRVLPASPNLTYDLAELEYLLGEPLVGLAAPLLRLGPLDRGAVGRGTGRRWCSSCTWEVFWGAAWFLSHQVYDQSSEYISGRAPREGCQADFMPPRPAAIQEIDSYATWPVGSAL